MKNDAISETIRAQNFRRAKILIIENDLSQIAIIEHYLRECLPEVESVKATNEEQAMTYLNISKIDEWELPKMILLNVFMPLREDGWRILRRIKELPAPANQIPVVILTHSAQIDDISEAYDRGISSYLVKPADEAEWLAYFQMLRKYWWETVSLPQTNYRY